MSEGKDLRDGRLEDESKHAGQSLERFILRELKDSPWLEQASKRKSGRIECCSILAN
jgi:hypothetical protein